MMTISMSDLARAMAVTNVLAPAAKRETIRPAFISEAAFSVGDQGFAAVVTADYIDRVAGTFEITFDLLGWSAGYDPVSITIDDSDIRAIREMLGIGHEIAPAPNSNDGLPKQLAVALKTLRIIADMEEVKQEPAESWRQTLFNTIETAQWAVETIERMEADDGTPNDS